MRLLSLSLLVFLSCKAIKNAPLDQTQTHEEIHQKTDTNTNNKLAISKDALEKNCYSSNFIFFIDNSFSNITNDPISLRYKNLKDAFLKLSNEPKLVISPIINRPSSTVKRSNPILNTYLYSLIDMNSDGVIIINKNNEYFLKNFEDFHKMLSNNSGSKIGGEFSLLDTLVNLRINILDFLSKQHDFPQAFYLTFLVDGLPCQDIPDFCQQNEEKPVPLEYIQSVSESLTSIQELEEKQSTERIKTQFIIYGEEDPIAIHFYQAISKAVDTELLAIPNGSTFNYFEMAEALNDTNNCQYKMMD